MSRKDRFFFAALAAMSAAPSLAMAVWLCAKLQTVAAAALLLTAALLMYAIAAVTRFWRYFFLFQLPMSLPALAFAAYTIRFGMPPGDTVAQLLVEASREEIRGFLAVAHGSWAVGLGLAAWILCYLGFSLLLPPRRIFSGNRNVPVRVLIISCACVAAYCLTNPAQLSEGVSLNPVVGSLMFSIGTLPRASSELRSTSVHKLPYGARRRAGEEVHILVIGESSRRSSWSAYGYTRPTTPNLDAMKNQVVLLRDALADANLTSWSVPIMLTGLSPENFTLSNIRGNLLDLAKEGGYSTAWLVNQDMNISRSIGLDPDRFVLPVDPKANIFGRGALDEALLPAYLGEIARSGKPRFIGVHMMGSHWEYFRRYSAAFERFGSHASLQKLSSGSLFIGASANPAALVDAYDNSTLYTDWFLNQLIVQAAALHVPATLLYYPDHGEDLLQLDGTMGHGFPSYTRHTFEVPAFIWLNREFGDAHPEIVAAIKANAAKEIRTHDVFYTEAELMGITWPGADARHSFASENFRPDEVMKFAAGGVLVTRPR